MIYPPSFEKRGSSYPRDKELFLGEGRFSEPPLTPLLRGEK